MILKYVFTLINHRRARKLNKFVREKNSRHHRKVALMEIFVFLCLLNKMILRVMDIKKFPTVPHSSGNNHAAVRRL